MTVADRLAGLLVAAAADHIVPRYRALAATDIAEKSPGEVVTAADHAAEAFLTPALAALVPGSRVVGEEAAAADPALLRGLDHGAVWVLDPLDGTANFARGAAPFAVMACLLRDGVPVMAGIHDPMAGVTHLAERGRGAWRNGVRLRVGPAPMDAAGVTAALFTKFLPDDLRAAVPERAKAFGRIVPGKNCAGAEYPALLYGDRHVAIFWRTLPWDHAPGLLLLQEAGGSVTRLDGAPYHPADDRKGLLVARTPQLAEVARRVLLP